MTEIDIFSQWQEGICITFRRLEKRQTSPQEEAAVGSGPSGAPRLWCELSAA